MRRLRCWQVSTSARMQQHGTSDILRRYCVWQPNDEAWVNTGETEKRAGCAMLRDGGSWTDEQLPLSGDPRDLRLRRYAQEQALAGVCGSDSSSVCQGASVCRTRKSSDKDTSCSSAAGRLW